jgi:CBS domain-containing protein
MKVSDIMSAPVTTAPDTSVGEVARLMVDRQAAGIAVVDAVGAVLGIVSQSDLVAKHARVHMPRYLGILGYIVPLDRTRTEDNLRHILSVTASDLMSHPGPSLATDAEIDDAASLMVDDDIDPVLVREGDRLVGMVSRMDVVRLLVIEEASDAV